MLSLDKIHQIKARAEMERQTFCRNVGDSQRPADIELKAVRNRTIKADYQNEIQDVLEGVLMVIKMADRRMFGFITHCWNPICMRCQYGCFYCWSEALKDGRLRKSPRYQKLASNGNACYLVDKELHRHFKAGDYVFVEDCGDLFASDVPDVFIQQVLLTIWQSPEAKFLLLTKNPWRMVEWQHSIPENCLCGCTIETNRTMNGLSKAPAPQNRYMAMKELDHPHKMICIEPIVDFDLAKFVNMIASVDPHTVVVGYDNYPKRHAPLMEPELSKTEELIKHVRQMGIEVITKTLREKWQ